MKKERFILVFIIIVFFFICVSNIYANTSNIIGENYTGGYQYKVTNEEKLFKWKIGHKEKVSFIIENQENTDDLDRFRKTVNQISLQKTKLILSISYLFFIIISTLIVKRKKKSIPQGVKIFLIVLIAYTLYISFNTLNDLYDSFNNANLYFHRLIN